MSKCCRGSEWRRWDLHIHSNASDGKATPAEIIQEAKAKGLSVIALTDHHTVNNIDELKRLGEDENITVISGIEFRTEYGAKSVHMIGLFPDKYEGTVLTQTALRDLILAPLNLSETTIIAEGKKDDSSLDDIAAFKRGIFMVQVDFKKAAELIHQYGGIITVHAGDKASSIEEMKHQGKALRNVDLLVDSLGTVKEDLLRNFIDICEVQKCSEADFYLKKFGLPAIAASDAHTKDAIGSKFTWIKADPTFNGLKQIKYEPDTRVCIRADIPESKSDYMKIDYVEIVNPDFAEAGMSAKVVFNSNLNCIIGGKSTGKSLLLNNMAYAIDSEQVISKYKMTRPVGKKKKDDTYEPIDGFAVHWVNGEVSSHDKPLVKKIVYIPQTYLNRLSDEKEERTEIDDLIEEILLQDNEIKARYDKCHSNIDQLKQETDKLIYDYVSDFKKLGVLKEQLLENASSLAIQKEIEKLEEERKKFMVGSEVSEDQSQQFSQDCEELQKIKGEETSILHDISVLESSGDAIVVLPTELNGIQSQTKEYFAEVLLELQGKISTLWKTEKEKLIEKLKVRLAEISEIQPRLEKRIEELKPIIESNANLLSISAKVTKEKGKKQEAIRIESEIKQQEQKMQTWLTSLANNAFKYREFLEEYTCYVNERNRETVQGLDFKLETVLRSDALKGRLLEVLNNKSLSRFTPMKINDLNEDYYTNEILRQLINSIQKNDSTSLELKAQYDFEGLLRDLLSNWFNINYIVKMENDEFEKMSPGKKALVLLKLLIGLADSDCPMLIDQPEDDLDNRSIFDDLVTYIKAKKAERQLIIVTHNANIVVGSDAEEIIVANQNGLSTPNDKYKFEYISGAIEDSWENKAAKATLVRQGIKEHICEVLEGGEVAFEKRRNKYKLD